MGRRILRIKIAFTSKRYANNAFKSDPPLSHQQPYTRHSTGCSRPWNNFSTYMLQSSFSSTAVSSTAVSSTATKRQYTTRPNDQALARTVPGPTETQNSSSNSNPRQLTHLNSNGAARMVTLPPPFPPSSTSPTTPSRPLQTTKSTSKLPAHKPPTARLARATSTLHFTSPHTLSLIKTASLKKGDVFSVSRIAGISASKMASALIPLCHNIPLSGVDVDVEVCDPGSVPGARPAPSDVEGESVRDEGSLRITATARTFGQTGVEMEALIAASTAGLSAYDMCKSVDRGMWMGGIRVVEKRGGASGDYIDGRRVGGDSGDSYYGVDGGGRGRNGFNVCEEGQERIR